MEQNRFKIMLKSVRERELKPAFPFSEIVDIIKEHNCFFKYWNLILEHECGLLLRGTLQGKYVIKVKRRQSIFYVLIFVG